MMKHIVCALVIVGFLCTLGCGRREISSEGKVLRLLSYRTRPNVNPQAIRHAEDAIRAIPSKAPIMERLEWGRIRGESTLRYYVLVLFEDQQLLRNEEFFKATQEVVGLDDLGPYFSGAATTPFFIHDATPHVRTSTHGMLRRVVQVHFNPDTTREQMQEFEDKIVALPDQISEITRLEWGASTGYDPADPAPQAIDPNFRNGSYCVLFTFARVRARDACLAHPAYAEFQRMAKDYSTRTPSAYEFVSRVEYIADSD